VDVCESRTCEQECHIEMRTVTRTVYEMVEETKHKTVYDIISKQQEVHDVRRVPVVQYVTQEYTYNRPVMQTLTREVPYTICRPVYETHSRDVQYMTYHPVTETRTRTVSHTVYHPVQETRTRTVYHSVPRKICYTKTIKVHSGRWETCVQECPKGSEQKGVQKPDRVCKRVWVPHVEEREVTCSKIVYDQRAKVVPYTVTRTIPEVQTRDIEYTVSRMVPMCNTRTVYYQVARMIPEQHTRTVAYSVTQMVPETGTRTVPVTTYREIPTCRTITVPQQVPRTVCYTVKRCVPRTECVQVPVRVCRPAGKGSCQKGESCQKGDMLDDIFDPTVPEPPGVPADPGTPAEPIEPEEEPEPSTTAMRLASLTESYDDTQSAAHRFVTGLDLYRSAKHRAALAEFAAAVNADPDNAKYVYFCALAQRQLGLHDLAESSVARAVHLEQAAPVANWGRVMERVQGPSRLWLEDARRQVALTR
jgi:hypothetical protein